MLKSLFSELRQKINGALRRPSGPTTTSPRNCAEQAATLLDAGDIDRAERQLLECLHESPDDPRLLYIHAAIHSMRGRYDEAIALFNKSLSLQPENADAHRELGALYYFLGDYENAKLQYQACVDTDPGSAEVLTALGATCIQRREFGEAEQVLKRALAINPELADTQLNLGIIYQETGDNAAATTAFEKAIELAPDNGGAWLNYSLALRLQERFAEARHAAEKAGKLNAKQELVNTALGQVALDLGDAEDAAAHFRKAIETGGTRADSYLNLAQACRDLGRLDESGDYIREALRIDNHHAEAHLSLALHELRRGNYADGWQHYEMRLKSREAPGLLSGLEVCNGSPCERKLVLVREQGLGDQIMFGSCLPDLAACGGSGLVLCDSRLAGLFKRSFPAFQVAGEYAATPNEPQGYECQLPMGSLPRHFRQSQDDFPQHAGYLVADASLVTDYRERLQGLGSGLKIGLSWRGGLAITRQAYRSVALEQLLPLFGPDRHFVSLQHTDCQEEIESLRTGHDIGITHWPEMVADLDHMAACIRSLDLVISVCNTVVHLSGALGQRTWVLTPYIAEWRYGHHDEHMDWYPSIRLFRQTRLNDWSEAIRNVTSQLDII